MFMLIELGKNEVSSRVMWDIENVLLSQWRNATMFGDCLQSLDHPFPRR